MRGAIRLAIVATAAALVAATSANNVKNKRYCEVLFVRNVNGSTVADVYNTFGLNDCPPSLWNALTPANARDNTSLAVVLNGPRYWLMDSIQSNASSSVVRPVKNVGGINMTLSGRVPVPLPLPATKLYTPNFVARNVSFVWKAGSTVFILTRHGDGHHDGVSDQFIMQSYSQQVDPMLNLTCLSSLRLPQLPKGWTYKAKRLRKDVNVTTPSLVGGNATVGIVIQDDFQNSYSYVGNVDAYLRR
ncbi:hypothetical protein H310_09294 [Aphanomyces invadans]|uniref:Uncharacterized protein n=1 Tax=Aphanomyces invadans TaxID=157072 RepID=A0A024TV00_9STRA|nr:hypothetical protein H310_09294 [Aphanomyces invadans]ETV97990.1 hypothetical protein H310_09294 [Aphanomyces invadans]|eukprot:XP_008873551.1 hypothetical protein H310_09294 [Aphanomyces invadans]